RSGRTHESYRTLYQQGKEGGKRDGQRKGPMASEEATGRLGLLAVRSAKQTVVVAVQHNVQRLADLPGSAGARDVAADRSICRHPGVRRRYGLAHAAAVVTDDYVQFGGDERAEHRGGLVLSDFSEPGNRLRFRV